MKIDIVLYDGDCNFCNNWVYFIKRKLKKNKISFIPFNSFKGIEIVEKLEIKNQNSVVYIENEIIFFKSKAVFKICKQLELPYSLIYVFKILPDFLLNYGYDFIAKRRLKLTSKKKCCNG